VAQAKKLVKQGVSSWQKTRFLSRRSSIIPWARNNARRFETVETSLPASMVSSPFHAASLIGILAKSPTSLNTPFSSVTTSVTGVGHHIMKLKT
jgi:hypothetical protein